MVLVVGFDFRLLECYFLLIELCQVHIGITPADLLMDYQLVGIEISFQVFLELEEIAYHGGFPN